MKIAVITANIGGFDKENEMPQQDIAFDRFYINDNNCPYTAYKVDNRLKAKIFKIIPHKVWPGYDVYVWVDGNIKIKATNFISRIVSKLEGGEVVISRHSERSSIYEEAEFIITELKKGHKYLKARYTADSIQKEVESFGPGIEGLYWCGCFARVNSDKVNRAFDDWFIDNVIWSYFDQNSFVYEMHKHQVKLNIIEWGNYYVNDHYGFTEHKKVK
ncbi:MAG TPA: glycosyltransferase domain-containing protein [Chitinophagaceae bacterium]|jgi:hypothetical protein|nr:glycosyltransferase domain-containing protein [Chitinophagaceae bacterium]